MELKPQNLWNFSPLRVPWAESGVLRQIIHFNDCVDTITRDSTDAHTKQLLIDCVDTITRDSTDACTKQLL